MIDAATIETDVAIVGGSHAGLAMALALAGTLGPGVGVALVERRQIAPYCDPLDPRAFALSAGSVALLTAIGVWPLIESDAQPVTAIDITDSSLDHALRPTLLAYENHIAPGQSATFIVMADRLLGALAQRVLATPSISVFAPVDIRSFELTPTARPRATLADGRTLAAGLLIAADGARSTLREAAGIKSISWSYPQTGIVTVVEHERPHKGRAVQHFLPAGPFAVLPLKGGHRSCITWTETSDTAACILRRPDPDFAHEIERRLGHKLGALTLTGARRTWPLEMRLARSLVAPRVALIGDAARSVHPLAGQGLNLGLRDVAALTEMVADTMRVGLDPGDATGLDRYERWRRFDGQSSAAAYDALNLLFSNDSTLVRSFRDVGLGIVDRLPGLKQMFVEEAAGLTGDVPALLKGAFP